MSAGLGTLRKESRLASLRAAAANARDFAAVCSRALAAGWKEAPGLSAGLWGMVLLQSVAPAATAYLYKGMVDALVAAVSQEGAGTGVAWRALGLYLIVLFFSNQLIPVFGTIRDQLGERLSVFGEKALMEAVLSHPDLSPFEDQSYYNDLQSIRSNLSHAYRFVVQTFPHMVSGCVTLASYCVIAATFHPALVAALLLAGLPGFRVYERLESEAWTGITAHSPLVRWMNHMREILLADRYAKEVRLYGTGPFFLKQYDEAYEKRHRELCDLRLELAAKAAAYTFASSAAIAVSCGLVVASAVRGAITVGDIALYTSVLFGAAGQIETLSKSYGFLSAHYKTLDLLRKFVSRPPSIRIAPDGVRFAGIRQGIALRNVSFRYPGSERKSLDGIDLELPAGKVIALVGENGAGKTTLVKLLTRLVDPTEGEILIDGTPLSELDLASYRRGVTAVFQDFGRYQMSVRENIGIADVARMADEGAIAGAARQAGAEELIESLSGGYDQVLGRQFTGGRELSGGEWQKVALARAFLRSHADLVILDEPTAALDARAEYEIFRRFAELSAGRTTILVSHRFSTVRMADLIVVLEKGRVIETGSHAELMAAGGVYAELYTLQSERYR